MTDRLPGSDPGGPWYRALLTILRDVVLGSIGDWIDGPPGWWWASLQTALFLAVCAVAAFGHGVAQAQAATFLEKHGQLYIGFLGATFGAWLAFKGVRMIWGPK